MKRANRISVAILFAALLTIAAGCSGMQDYSSGLGAGTDVLKVATLSDDDVKYEAMAAIKAYDGRHEIAPAGSRYDTRLKALTRDLVFDDDLKLNFKVYVIDEVNAFAMADGSIRIYSALMDMMDDQELLFVIGHEIGHVKLGHRKKALKLAHAASAARKGAASQGGATGAVAGSALGDFAEELINAQFSQSEERDADNYSIRFLSRNSRSTEGALSALKKLARLGGRHGIFSSHPDPEERAKRLSTQM